MPTLPSHSRRPSATHQPRPSHHQDALPSPSPSSLPKPSSRSAAPPSLLRLPSTGSHAAPTPSPPVRRATNPTTPTVTPGQASTASSAASSSYFSPSQSSAQPARSPGSRKPPAFFSGHGIDASRGPPNSLITRGNVDIARRSQGPIDSSIPSPQSSRPAAVAPSVSASSRARRGSESSNITAIARPDIPLTSQREPQEETPMEGISSYSSGLRSQSEEPHAKYSANGSIYTSGTEGEQNEDLFIAAANSGGPDRADAPSRADRLRSRIAIRSNRQSFPSTLRTGATPSNRTTPAVDSITGTQRRASHFSFTPRSQREQSPLTPANPLETPRSRALDLSPKQSFSSPRTKDHELSPHQFLAQLSQRRPSYPDSTLTPPTRAHTYRPSNLQYTSSRVNPETTRVESHAEDASRAGTTESVESTGPAASVWDELDELKSRIRRIELGGKIPTTSGAAVANASAERPRTATTSNTTVSSSPKHQRKANPTPPDSTAGAQGPQKAHPLLKEALVKVKQHVTPSVYRVLEATASEALALAEMAGSAGPQGTLHSASSILGGGVVPDRHVRRKADNICRSLTELCIELCDMKASVASPAVRTATVSATRRPSVQVNGESPNVRASVEPESDTVPRSSPSRALSRIEARKANLKMNGTTTQISPLQSHFSTRLTRTGTSMDRTNRHTDDEDDDPTLRAPSRAMTDFRDIRAVASLQSRRISRDFSPREPKLESQSFPSAHYTPSSYRRPTVSGTENNVLFRETPRRYNLDRQNTPAPETQNSTEFTSRLVQPSTQYTSNRAMAGAMSLARSGSLGRRAIGNGAGE
ncbi:uncharacterized protein EI97DRAFT_443370 [Westerdykella ornata]|uniref:Uncharacterized protein n=1 Tax=Westerdykella ornata TaxID=318751 RepID=A0A6A6JHF2_WESOR|nr:uncharacterized protein EI97DRAFT_443370 [Westerdykella ornata]KAF2275533.1 hypothetical protein EI97DRAFT_443370 [Westerdykella ornata]